VHSLEAALAYYDKLEKRFAELLDNPLLYPAVDSIRVGYRRTVCGVHSVYYLVETEEIVIVRILKKQNPLRQLPDS
jgi:toxin ParE1/3/4